MLFVAGVVACNNSDRFSVYGMKLDFILVLLPSFILLLAYYYEDITFPENVDSLVLTQLNDYQATNSVSYVNLGV